MRRLLLAACIALPFHLQATGRPPVEGPFSLGDVDGPRPHILFFLVDDMGLQDTSLPFSLDDDGNPVATRNNTLYRTPHMERLAAQGVRFTQAYAYTLCSPTRVSIMTGLAAPRHGVTQWTHPVSHKKEPGPAKTKTMKSPPWSTSGIPEGVPVLPKLLKAAGYSTLFAGKAHFGPNDTPNGDPLNLGFDINIAGFGGGGPGSYWGKYNYSAEHRRGGSLWNVPGLEKYHGTDTFLTEAITLEMREAIQQAAKLEKPFFVYMSHYALHAPFLYPDHRYTANYPDLKGHALAHATLIEGMDKSLGDLLQTLDELGEAEDTLVIFYSDNGSVSPLGTPGLRGKKGTRFEGGSRVPLIAAWAKPNPENEFQKALPIKAGSIETDIVTCNDIMPTLLALAGAELPQDARQDGHSLIPYFRGQDGTHRPQDFLIHFPHKHYNTLFSSWRQGDFKIIYNYASATWELYNLKRDPEEKTNVVLQHPERASALARRMVAELDAMRASYPVRLDDGSPIKPNLSLIP